MTFRKPGSIEVFLCKECHKPIETKKYFAEMCEIDSWFCRHCLDFVDVISVYRVQLKNLLWPMSDLAKVALARGLMTREQINAG